MLFKNLSIEKVKEIATLAFGHKEWITSEINVCYQPYIKEHYEDADEFFEANFEAYFMGNSSANYKVQIRPTLDVTLWYSFKDDKNQILHISNQTKIQKILSNFYTEKDLINLIQFCVANEEMDDYGSISQETAKYYLDEFLAKNL